MVDILNTVHFSSIDAYLMEQLRNDSELTPPHSLKKLYPDLFWGVDDKAMRIEMNRIMDIVKMLNVLSHFLYYKKDFVSVLDITIDETLLLLKEKAVPKNLSDREAYNAIVVLIGNIKPSVITSRLRELLRKEEEALSFLLIMRDAIAHRILFKEQNPFDHGQIF